MIRIRHIQMPFRDGQMPQLCIGRRHIEIDIRIVQSAANAQRPRHRAFHIFDGHIDQGQGVCHLPIPEFQLSGKRPGLGIRKPAIAKFSAALLEISVRDVEYAILVGNFRRDPTESFPFDSDFTTLRHPGKLRRIDRPRQTSAECRIPLDRSRYQHAIHIHVDHRQIEIQFPVRIRPGSGSRPSVQIAQPVSD